MTLRWHDLLSTGCLLTLLAGCGETPSHLEEQAAADASADAAPMVNADAGLEDAGLTDSGPMADAAPQDPDAATSGPVPASGTWRLVVKLVDVGGLEVPFTLELAVDEATRRVTQFVLSATAAGGAVSAPVITAADLPIDSEGTFEVPETVGQLPAAFSPTNSDVEISFALTVHLKDDGLCGEVVGSVPTLDNLPIVASTFGAVPEDSGEAPPTSCADDGPVQFARIDTCPQLVPGTNTGFESAGVMRSFELFVPDDIETAESVPLIFLHHGFTSSAARMLELSQLDTYVDEFDFVLVVPSSRNDGLDWAFLSPDDSPDLAFFDDIVKCATAQYGIDPLRIHVTGLSAGALWTSYVGVFRSEVVASVAPVSAGLLPAYPNPPEQVPFLTVFGGPSDAAYDQDFKLLTERLNADLLAGGHFVTTCDHDDGHRWRPDFTPWVLEFLLDHPKGVDPLPYLGGLPEAFPDYCQILE